MKRLLTNLLSFSKRELNGISVFILAVIFYLCAPVLYRRIYPPAIYDFSKFQAQVDAYVSDSIRRNTRHVPTLPPRMFRFDPNSLDQAGWEMLGLSEQQAATIIRYRSKGGRFRRKEDLKKMYAISPFMYTRLESYIVIKPDTVHPVVWQVRSPRPVKMLLELNTADSADLDALRGIGPAFASRIIKFRNRLGGYVRKEQLLEVYGMDSVRYATVSNFVRVNDSLARQLMINGEEIGALRGHPYLSYKQYNALLAFRREHGPFRSVEDLKKVLILDSQTIEKLRPYLRFDHDQ